MPDLSGKHFLVLRPKATSEKLLRCLSESKAKVSHFPMFELEPRSSKELQSMLDTLDAAEKVIFVSPSAVEFFLARLGELGLDLPEKARCFAPGFSTASTLAARSKAEARYPKDVGDATSLLSMPEFEGVEGQRIDIIGGESGSHQIIFELLRRGANATYVSCYRSRPSEPVSDEILAAHRADPLSAIIAHSRTALTLLRDMLGERLQELRQVPVLTHHRAIMALAKNEGFGSAHLARSGSGEAIVALAAEALAEA